MSDFEKLINASDLIEWIIETDPDWCVGSVRSIIDHIDKMPSAQPDAIPIEWIAKHLEWLDNCDNDFAQLAKVSIKAMVELWKKDRI